MPRSRLFYNQFGSLPKKAYFCTAKNVHIKEGRWSKKGKIMSIEGPLALPFFVPCFIKLVRQCSSESEALKKRKLLQKIVLHQVNVCLVVNLSLHRQNCSESINNAFSIIQQFVIWNSILHIELFLIKFGHSEKGTKFEKIFHLKFDATE